MGESTGLVPLLAQGPGPSRSRGTRSNNKPESEKMSIFSIWVPLSAEGPGPTRKEGPGPTGCHGP